VFWYLRDLRVWVFYTRIWVDLKIDGFFHLDFQKIARIRFSQPLRVAYNGLCVFDYGFYGNDYFAPVNPDI